MNELIPSAIVKTRLVWESYAKPEVRAAIIRWFEQHGLAVPNLLRDGSGWVEVDHQRHTIEWPHGECTGCGDSGKYWPGCQPVTTTEQGEADPRPLPYTQNDDDPDLDDGDRDYDTRYNGKQGYQVVRTRTVRAQ